MNNDYDPVAPFYDRLAGLIFGNSQVQAQEWLLQYLPPQSRILIVGGGTGWVLEKIAEKHQAGLDIVYLEKSGKMLNLSRQRNCGTNKVEYLHSDVAILRSERPFDAIVTGFLFDNLSQQLADQAFASLSAQLSPGGLWLYADFETGSDSKLVHRWMLKAMYLFFGIICKVGTSQLPEMKSHFVSGYQQLGTKSFYQGFIRSYAYKKVV